MKGRLLLFSLFFTLNFGCAHRADVRDKGFDESFSTEEALEQSFAARRWAVLIGVNNYDDPLPH